MPSFQLTLSTSHEDMGLKVVLPWLRLRSLLAWQKQAPTVILLPTRIEAFYWKEKLVSAGHPLLGISFWTPSDARNFLLEKVAKGAAEIVTLVDLELHTRVAAELLMNDPALPTASLRFLQSIQINPSGFLAHFEMLNGAGWAMDSTGSSIESQLAEQLQSQLARLNLQTQAQAHAMLRKEMVNRDGERSALLADLLIAGFNGNYWPIWDLLAAISLAAEQTAVALMAPQTFAAQPDQVWVNSWEKWCGAGYEVAVPEEEMTQSPFATLAASFEKGTVHRSSKNLPAVIVAPDLITHARAIVTQTLLWLRQPDCTRIGLIFPNTGPLSLAVAEQLQLLQIPHNNGTGYLVPSQTFAQPPWLTWLDLQENPTAANFLAWYLACQNESSRERVQSTITPDSLELSLRLGEPFQPGAIKAEEEPTAHEVAAALTYAVDKLLIDSLPVLQKQLEKSSDRRQLRLAEILRDYAVQLPAQATLTGFLQATLQVVQAGQLVEAALPKWVKRLAAEQRDDEPLLSRSTYLTWLRATTDKRSQKREGNDYYSKVHLLIAAQMPGQSWSHLLLADMNRGVWPKEPEPTPLLSSRALNQLNKAARQLNRQNPLSTEDSNFDAHPSGRGSLGHGYCLAPADRPEISLRDLCHALENTSTGLCLTASLKQGDRMSSPNELFSHCFQAARKSTLDDATFQKLAVETGQLWGSRRHAIWETEPVPKKGLHGEKTQAPLPPSADIIPEPSYTAFAFRTRRDVDQPFGPFQFCYHAEPELPIQMSCGDWDQALRNPPSGWFAHILGAQSSPALKIAWQKTSGIWLHSWIRGGLQNLDPDIPADELLDVLFGKVDREIETTQSLVDQMCRETGTLQPHWWVQVLRQSRAQTEQVLTALSAKLPTWTAFSEARLTDNILVTPSSDRPATLVLSGRLDCLLIERASQPEPTPQDDDGRPRSSKLPPLERRNVWVVDFKTGAPFKLTTKVLGEPQRKGWQPVLYGWALRRLGAGRVLVSLLNPGEPEGVLDLDDVLLNQGLFLQLDRMHRAGKFGQPPGNNGEFGFTPPMPIATLSIARPILEAKWKLSQEGEEEEMDDES